MMLLTAVIGGKCGIWQKKPLDAESAVGAESPKVWAQPALIPQTPCRAVGTD